jgi:acyl-CoA thioester hydrolase
MARVTIDMPETFSFSCIIPVRITDVNYGNHVGNDAILSIIHEARMQFLKSHGYTELDLAGAGTIMADVAIQFKSEAFYGDQLLVSVVAGEISKIGFDLYYKLETISPENKKVVANAKSGMICYDYTNKKIVSVPEEVKQKLSA